MSKYHSYLNNAQKLIKAYPSGMPFSLYLKNFFSTEKKFGSKDRKMISNLCYHYFRCYYLFDENINLEDKIIQSVFLCEQEPNDFLAFFEPALNEKITLQLNEKLTHADLRISKKFPFIDFISPKIDSTLLIQSYFIQPNLFVRIRPSKEKTVLNSLTKAGLPFKLLTENCIELENRTKVETVLKINKEAVIQDYNSQKVFDFFADKPFSEAIKVWDVCAASGGKSLLLYDILNGKIKLTVSDIRKNILANLRERLGQAGINLYHQFVQDVSLQSGLHKTDLFNLVICDVPCSGSGTWARTPEQILSFDQNQIQAFQEKQKAIIQNAIPHIQSSGYLIYITCSIFKIENEDMAEHIEKNFSLKLLESKYLCGYEQKADTMYVAIFKKN